MASTLIGRQAVVVGAGMAGLPAARALADFFELVVSIASLPFLAMVSAMILKQIALFPLYKLLEFPVFYHLTQQVGLRATHRFRKLIVTNLSSCSERRIPRSRVRAGCLPRLFSPGLHRDRH